LATVSSALESGDLNPYAGLPDADERLAANPVENVETEEPSDTSSFDVSAVEKPAG